MEKRYNVSDFDIVEYKEADSTNTIAEQIPFGELKDKMVILTWQQTQGRGQASNKWESELGKNIAMTIILRPKALEASKQFAISTVIALGVADLLRRYVDDVTVKWPNDIYVGEKKIAGILIEHCISGPYIQQSLCGIGVNINQQKFLSDSPNPVSLWQLIGREIPLARVLEELLEDINKRYTQLEDMVTLEKDFCQQMYRAEGIHNWEDINGSFRGAIQGIDKYGQLMLKDTTNHVRVYAFKEVRYC